METTAPRHEWRSRHLAALAVRGLVVLAPILVAILSSIVLGRILPKASGPLIIVRIVAIIAGSSFAMIKATSLVQRLLPLAVLLKVTLVFPDVAPSRFSVALRRSPDTERRAASKVQDTARLTGEGTQPASPHVAASSELTPGEVTAELADLLRRLGRHHRLTRGHSERVRAYAELIAAEMKLRESDRNQLRWAALLHDIGKLEVPVEILDLAGRPDAAQWKFIADHPSHGEALAEPIRGWLGEWAPGIWQHHEKFNGTGYPAQLAGKEISLAGRIVAVADAFETMTATRSYKKPMAIDAARTELVACAGKHFDPEIVRLFLKVGIGELRGVVGLTALLQTPLLIINQLGGFGKLIMRTGSAGVVATATVVSGVAGDVSAAKPAVAAVVVSAPVPTTVTPAPGTTIRVIVTTDRPAVLDTAVAVTTPVPTTIVAGDSTTSTSTSVALATSTTFPPTTTAPSPTTVPSSTTTVGVATTTTAATSAPTTVATTTTTLATTTTTAMATTTTTRPATTTTTTTLPTTTTTTTLAPTTTTTTTLAPTTTTTTLPPAANAVNDSVNVTSGQPTVVSPLSNDSPGTGAWVLSSFTKSNPAGVVGVYFPSNGTVLFTVTGNSGTKKTVTYRITNTNGETVTATITLNIL